MQLNVDERTIYATRVTGALFMQLTSRERYLCNSRHGNAIYATQVTTALSALLP